ncbi:hypothetical protein BJ508DRAFT_306278 [Ascobolus immersus RN42]|uniref:Uncharacterized protein n=1 Tax=Ascobolus immersus RN42 TaxID=1160509 RepID=A0A3N4I6E6_ASCIM|nr:hypothetical protein BJ508DRAFT_306278 [Ascobolus immersus RN42]
MDNLDSPHQHWQMPPSHGGPLATAVSDQPNAVPMQPRDIMIAAAPFMVDADVVTPYMCKHCGMLDRHHEGTDRAIHLGCDNSPAVPNMTRPRRGESFLIMPGVASDGTIHLAIVPYTNKLMVKDGGQLHDDAPYGWLLRGQDNKTIKDLILSGHVVTGNITHVWNCFLWNRQWNNYIFDIEWEVVEPFGNRTPSVLGIRAISAYRYYHGLTTSEVDSERATTVREEETSPLRHLEYPAGPQGSKEQLLLPSAHGSNGLQVAAPDSDDNRLLTDLGLEFTSDHQFANGHHNQEGLTGHDGNDTPVPPSSPPLPLERKLDFGRGLSVVPVESDEQTQLAPDEIGDSQILPTSIIGTAVTSGSGNAAHQKPNLKRRHPDTESQTPGANPANFGNAMWSALVGEDGIEFRLVRPINVDPGHTDSGINNTAHNGNMDEQENTQIPCGAKKQKLSRE